jgi:universal stress protein A
MNLKIIERQRLTPSDTSSEGNMLPQLDLSPPAVKTILVAVDFSAASRSALEYAAGLAKRLGAEIVLVHVFEGVPGELKILEATYSDTSFREEALSNLAEWEQHIAALAGRVKTVFREGTHIDREVIEVAVESGADLIVLGRHGSQSFAFHNTVKRILHRAPCAVLVAP